MTDNADHDELARPAAVLRLTALVIGSAEIIAFLLMAHLLLQSTDPLGESFGEAVTLLMAVPLIGLTLPGLMLAWLDRAPRTALLMVLAAIPVAALVWMKA